ncbi:MAG: LysR family transcriptional regulator [Lawsonibacter sp.]
MSILKYRAFLTTVEYKSLTKAAEVLGYTQPGISHMISSLEKELGFPLLVRTKDGVFPTENAENLQYYMQQIISAEDTLMETSYKIRGIELGSLRVGAFYSTSTRWLPEIVSAFLSQHPNIDLRIFEGTHGEVWDWLTNGVIDMAITSLPVPENYDFIPLWEDPILAVLSKRNELADRKVVDLEELIRFPFIAPNEGADESIWHVMQAEKLTPNIKFRVKGDMATISMIGQNLGVSLIPKLAIMSLQDNIVMRPLNRYYCRTLGICIPFLKHGSPAARAFIAETKSFIEKRWKE